MKRKFLILGAILIMAAGCSQKGPEPGDGTKINPEGSTVTTTEVSGGIDSTGKYTGNDGISRSGIKMIYFGTDRYQIDGDQLRRLMGDMPKIKQMAAAGKIRVEGNCDEFGTDEYNYALGLKRAKAVKQVLVSSGIPASSVTVVSYGESNRVCTGSTPACHAKNRRAEINRLK